MKTLLALLLCCVMLWGCESSPRGLRNLPPLTPPSEDTTASEQQGLYIPDSAMELQSAGALRTYLLPMEDPYGIRMLGEDLLVFSGKENTTLTLLSGEDLHIAAETVLSDRLTPDDPSLSFSQDTFSYHSKARRETVVLDHSFREKGRIPLPDMVDSPILSPEGSTLYYCTGDAIIAWDLKEDLHRTLKMLSYDRQSLTGLYLDGTVLHCRILDADREEQLFLSTQTGKLLHTHSGALTMTASSGDYFAAFPSGGAQTLVFGSEGQQPRSLFPRDIAAECVFLPHSRGAVTISSPVDGKIFLDRYDLTDGQFTGSVTLEEAQYPFSVSEGASGEVFLLSRDDSLGAAVIYRWDVPSQTASDSTVYTFPHYTADSPDLAGLEACRSQAERISEKYGIDIRIWKDAVAVQPWDYDLEPEHRVSVIQQELKTLEEVLALYPGNMLRDTASHFSSLSLCLVSQITGSAESGNLDTATGIQFLNGTDAYVAVAVGANSRQSLYHEFYHVMETHIFGKSIALDRWDELNPAGFRYDYSYLTNKTRDSGVYLRGESRSFVDTYSMSFPSEDRARIMEYAMLPGNASLFRSDAMQRKLRTLCSGIREAFSLEDYSGSLLWEQYLQ